MHNDKHHDHDSSNNSNDKIADSYKILKSGKGISGHHHDGPSDMPVESIRQFIHNGRSVSIKTTYEIKIDKKPLTGNLYIDDFGNVTCHTFPTYSFHSMTDFIRRLIDEYPESFQKCGESKT